MNFGRWTREEDEGSRLQLALATGFAGHGHRWLRVGSSPLNTSCALHVGQVGCFSFTCGTHSEPDIREIKVLKREPRDQ